jgi:hypothetical protein
MNESNELPSVTKKYPSFPSDDMEVKNASSSTIFSSPSLFQSSTKMPEQKFYIRSFTMHMAEAFHILIVVMNRSLLLLCVQNMKTNIVAKENQVL